jgi:hypothetical protein
MAKGQSRGNREKKKPKQDKPKVVQANPAFASTLTRQASPLPKKK